jgi:hypothetical protein
LKKTSSSVRVDEKVTVLVTNDRSESHSPHPG